MQYLTAPLSSQEEMHNHTVIISDTTTEIEHLVEPIVAADPDPTPAPPVYSSYGETADACLALEALTCITTLGCHLDPVSNTCMLGTIDEAYPSNSTDATVSEDDATALESATAAILDKTTEEEELETSGPTATHRRLLTQAKFGDAYERYIHMVGEREEKYFAGLAPDDSKAKIAEETTKVTEAQAATTSADSNVTTTQTTHDHDVTLSDLFTEEATQIIKGLQKATQAMQDDAQLTDGYSPGSMANCSSEEAHQEATCITNATNSIMDLEKQWMADAQKQADDWKNAAEEMANKHAELSKEAVAARAHMNTVHNASSAAVDDIAKADNVTMDPGPDFRYDDTHVYLGSLRDAIALEDKREECKAPRAKAYDTCETALDGAYKKCTETFESVRV